MKPYSTYAREDTGRSYKEVYEWGWQRLVQAEIPEAQLDARLLMEWSCGTDRNTLLVHGSRAVSTEEYDRYRQAVDQRTRRVPLQYITGEQEFMGLTFLVNRNVLIPRQDTEILVEEVLKNLHDGMHILDMCTGSGCILLSLLRYSNESTGIGADSSELALQVAKRNAERILGRDAALEKARASFVQGDLFQALDEKEKFDIIVSNPPYIRTDVIDTLMPEVRDYEPISALDGREDGLFYYRRICEQAGAYLYGGGMLFFEIGYDQGEEVSRLLRETGYTEVEIFKDYAGNDRVVQGTWCTA
ncbi:MAG: peptide chain release factor N(5)-glutamine methyltransferase [Lachnospiraceae bacterium]|nr:peptide chain release factor N(5)-glutamine methyltransferase [Lachnospiraceae bacterium]